MSRDVGNVRNQDLSLAKEVELDKTGKAKDTKSGSAKVMDAWLGKKNKKVKKEEKEEPEKKKAKKWRLC